VIAAAGFACPALPGAVRIRRIMQRSGLPGWLAVRSLAALCLAWVLSTGTAAAHPAPFSYIDIRLAPGAITGRLVVHDLDVVHDLGLGSVDALAGALDQQAAPLVALLQPRFRLRADGRDVPWTATAVRRVQDQDAVEVLWSARSSIPGRLVVEAAMFPYDSNHQTFLNVYEGDRLARQEVLDAARTSVEYFTGTRQGLWAVFRAFTSSGIHHIAIGPDHILFIVGLLLLGGSIRRLLAIVTAFTLGHSVTLALATLQILSPPARLVEPAIALSIVYVGADNLLSGRDSRDVRPWVALFFGLVHGFGFASVLRETGLPPQALGLSLFSFNLGVEIGQAAIVVIVASALGVVRARNAVLGTRLATAGSVVVMLAGAFWFVERVL
jgi:hydrogenase/urease accessory protein HupE